MARDIAWKDLVSLSRYRNKQCFLDNDLGLCINPGLVSSGLLSIIAPSSGFCTAVFQVEDELYPFILGQIYHPPNNPSAKLTILAPSTLTSHPGLGRVISHLVAKTGERGAFQILAEVRVNQPEEEVLSQAGFKAYIDQQIWKLPRIFGSDNGKGVWIPVSQRDQRQVDFLCQRIIPSFIQRIESSPSFPEETGLTCWQEDELIGFASTRFGPKGILIDLVLDAKLDQIDGYLTSLYFHLPYRTTRDVYFRVRSYQERIASSLERLGADPGPQQRAVVKKLAVHYNAKQTFRVQRFEEQPDITTPISNSKIKN
jgi:hypothetical protein